MLGTLVAVEIVMVSSRHASRHALVLGIGIVLLGAATQGCTIASPVYVEPVEQTSKTKDKTSKTKDDAATGQVGKACATDDFVKPDLGGLKPCGDGRGHCFPKNKVTMGDQFTACDAEEACVPDEVLEAGGGKLATCKAIIGEGGGCINMDLIPEMKERGGALLKQDACGTGLTCAPCIDDKGAATPFCLGIGAHENECTGAGDSPTPSAPAAPCCTISGVSHGKCISSQAVPEDQQASVKTDTCSAGLVCAPTAMADLNPVMCTPGLLGDAVCVATCFDDMLASLGGMLLDRDTCPADELCIPCVMAEMTGAKVPGCSLKTGAQQ